MRVEREDDKMLMDTTMTEYEKLVEAEKTFETIEIVETATGKVGVANTRPMDDFDSSTVTETTPDGVAVFYGADDGSDDKVISPEDFSRDFQITALVNG